MTYLDNAATTFPKPACVLNEIDLCLKLYCGNAGRSSHKLSLKSAEAIYETRECIANLLGYGYPERICFTYNATYAINLALKTFATYGCHIIISDFEHNAVMRPLEKLRNTMGIDYSVFSSDDDIYESISSLIRPNTTIILSSLASNVTGDEVPLSILSKIASEYQLYLIVDASQALGHRNINLSETPCDVLCAPGHKALFGIQGCGFACFKDEGRRESFIEGGSGTESQSLLMPQLLPEAYEAGTLSTPAIVSLKKGIEFITEIGMDNIQEKLVLLTRELEAMLCSIGGIKLYKSGIGILSFNLRDIPSSLISELLDERGICVRGGLHCAPSIHRKLNTLNQGALRASLSVMNSTSDIDRLYGALKRIAFIY